MPHAHPSTRSPGGERVGHANAYRVTIAFVNTGPAVTRPS
jgi:hypothetical protein